MNKKRILGTVGVAVAATIVAAPMASATGSGVNGYAKVVVQGSGLYVQDIQALSWIGTPELYGHFQITANGSTLANTIDAWWPEGSGQQLNTNEYFSNDTNICVTAWQDNGGGNYSNLGTACVLVHT